MLLSISQVQTSKYLNSSKLLGITSSISSSPEGFYLIFSDLLTYEHSLIFQMVKADHIQFSKVYL